MQYRNTYVTPVEGVASEPMVSAVLACLGAGALMTPLVALTISAASGLAGSLRHGAGPGRVLWIAFKLSVAAAAWTLAVPSLADAVAAGEWSRPGGELEALGSLALVAIAIGWLLAVLVRGLAEVCRKALEPGEIEGAFLAAMDRASETAERAHERIETRAYLGKDLSVDGLARRRAWLQSRVRWLEEELADLGTGGHPRRVPVVRLRRSWTLLRKRRAAAKLARVSRALEQAEEYEFLGEDELLEASR